MMKINLPLYDAKNNLGIMPVAAVFMVLTNSIILGTGYFINLKIFLSATLFSAIAAYGYSTFFRLLTGALKHRFPFEQQLLKRLTLTILTLLLISGLYQYFLFRGYELIPFFNYRFNENDFVWNYLSLGMLNIFLIFLMEGISKYKDWRENNIETEKLSEACKQSQLNALKSQVNPHFLFNSLNSLSSLIADDEEKAEKFLDEMSKVYRYMLRNDEEQLVTLDTELKFVDSYVYLLDQRFGGGLLVKVSIAPEYRLGLLPALALQVIIENTFTQNIIDKNNPLTIDITSDGSGILTIKNTTRPKVVTNAIDFETGLDNLIKKYGLLNKPAVVTDVEGHRLISLELLSKTEEVIL